MGQFKGWAWVLVTRRDWKRPGDWISNGDGSKEVVCWTPQVFIEDAHVWLNYRTQSSENTLHSCTWFQIFIVEVPLGVYKHHSGRQAPPCWRLLHMCIIFILPFIRCLSHCFCLPFSLHLVFARSLHLLWEIGFKLLLYYWTKTSPQFHFKERKKGQKEELPFGCQHPKHHISLGYSGFLFWAQ